MPSWCVRHHFLILFASRRPAEAAWVCEARRAWWEARPHGGRVRWWVWVVSGRALWERGPGRQLRTADGRATQPGAPRRSPRASTHHAFAQDDERPSLPPPSTHRPPTDPPVRPSARPAAHPSRRLRARCTHRSWRRPLPQTTAASARRGAHQAGGSRAGREMSTARASWRSEMSKALGCPPAAVPRISRRPISPEPPGCPHPPPSAASPPAARCAREHPAGFCPTRRLR